jgi:formate dehydrogenase gamma subunit
MTATEYVVRFSTRQRVEHAGVMLLFVVLAVTGFPQKFPDARWSPALANLLGGIESMRFLHRASGFLFAALAIVHIGTAAVGAARRRLPLTMVPTRQDFRDTLAMVRYFMGSTPERPRFGRFDYREKFEYWGLVFGALIMSATGVVLLFPIAFANIVGGALIPVAKVTHSQEGLMAFLVVIIWHIYNAHFAPEIFPFNRTIFTGKISRERLRHEHALEYAELFPDPTDAAAADAPASTGETPTDDEPKAEAAGFYWSPRRWAIVPLEAGAPFPGGAGEKYRRLPAVVALGIAPAMGGALAMFLPLVGFVMVPVELVRRAASALRRR